MAEKDSHCSYCGRPFHLDQPWPRKCETCGEISFRNPLPVAVVLVPVDGGLLLVRRGIEPQPGRLALPGGYINLGETWQEAGARELFEETGIVIEPHELQIFGVHSNHDRSFLLIFGLAKKRSADSLPAFKPNEETIECVIQHTPTELAFPLHTQVMREFFEARGPRRGP